MKRDWDSRQRLIKVWADEYADAESPAEKREALRHYLMWISVTLHRVEEEITGGKSSALLGHPEYFNKRPIRELEAHLLELDNGEVPAIFSVAKRHGRPSKSRKEQMWFAKASALITILMEDYKNSEAEAAKQVVDQLKIRGLPVPGSARANRASWKSLQAWRDELMRGKKGKLARAWYDETSTALPFDPLTLD